jgi:hypothetical protein
LLCHSVSITATPLSAQWQKGKPIRRSGIPYVVAQYAICCVLVILNTRQASARHCLFQNPIISCHSELVSEPNDVCLLIGFWHKARMTAMTGMKLHISENYLPAMGDMVQS